MEGWSAGDAFGKTVPRPRSRNRSVYVGPVTAVVESLTELGAQILVLHLH